MTNIKASVIIANHNNSRFINECIKSLKEQTYKNIEIIFFDDCSNDNSIEEVKKFSGINLITNTKNGKFGSFNQMNAYKQAFKKSIGEIIFFLDSDDYFCADKIEKVINKFVLDEKLKVVFDLPIYKYEDKIIKNFYKKKKYLKNYWPFIFPQSCISIRRDFIDEIFEETNFELFPDTWMDFRISVYTTYIMNNFFILQENLTYYRQSNFNVSSNFKFLGRSWWQRRLEAHEYIKFFFEKNGIKYTKNLDHFITVFVNKFIKIK